MQRRSGRSAAALFNAGLAQKDENGRGQRQNRGWHKKKAGIWDFWPWSR
jgi:hypothetical protein